MLWGAATQWQRQLPPPAEPDEHDRDMEVWTNRDLRTTQQASRHEQEMRLVPGSEDLRAPSEEQSGQMKMKEGLIILSCRLQKSPDVFAAARFLLPQMRRCDLQYIPDIYTHLNKQSSRSHKCLTSTATQCLFVFCSFSFVSTTHFHFYLCSKKFRRRRMWTRQMSRRLLLLQEPVTAPQCWEAVRREMPQGLNGP